MTLLYNIYTQHIMHYRRSCAYNYCATVIHSTANESTQTSITIIIIISVDTHNTIYYIVWRILYMIWYREVYIIWVLNGPISGENTKPLQHSDIYIYENSVTAKDTRTRENLYFFPPTLRHHRRTTCHSSANRYGTPSIYFCFFLFFSFHPLLLLIANLIYR